MKILIVGGGGREHALAWIAAQSTQVETVYVAPGNAGTVTENKITNIEINAEDIDALKIFAEKESVDLTIVGPEAPLVAGIVDEFQKAELLCFGPTKAAAILEGSKSFSKDFLKKYKIPTAEYEIFTEESAAVNYVKSKKMPIVIKADGLAAGKGVVVATSENEAIETINQMLSGNKFGDAGHRIVIEEFLEGEEVSFIVISDGKNVLPLATSQDHKARDDGDNGPNTGGMGAYSPAPIVDDVMQKRILDEIILPTVKGMEHVQKLNGDNVGAILISGHMGNWELLSSVSAECGLPLLNLYRSANNPYVEKLLINMRTEMGGSQHPKSIGGVRALIKGLENRDHVGMLIDQKYNEGVLVPFLGQDAMTTDAPAALAMRFKVPIVPARVERVSGAYFRVTVLPPMLVPDTGDIEADKRRFTEDINKLFSDWIFDRPEQWLWLHRRWPLEAVE